MLSRFVDGIMIRTFAQQEVEDLAKYGSIPVINGLTDYAHPCQVLADLMTIREHKGMQLQGPEALLCGRRQQHGQQPDRGLREGGYEDRHRLPQGYDAGRWAGTVGQGERAFDHRRGCARSMAKDADVLYTDVWASAWARKPRPSSARRPSRAIQVNDAVMAVAKPDAMVQHCLPAHRGEEITNEVMEAHADNIFDEAENRLHAQKAVLVKLMKK